MANLSATHNWPQSAFCLTGMVQSYVIQFESLPQWTESAVRVLCGRTYSVFPLLWLHTPITLFLHKPRPHIPFTITSANASLHSDNDIQSRITLFFRRHLRGWILPELSFLTMKGRFFPPTPF